MITNRRTLLNHAALAAATLPFLRPGAALAQGLDESYLAMVHPDLRPAARAMIQMSRSAPPLTSATLASQREGMKAWAQPPRTDVPFERRVVAGAKGQPDVTLYVVNAKPGANRGAILHTHGGGYVLGSADLDVRNLQNLCAELDCAAVSVDYRLAPETTWAGSLEDNYAGLKWLHANAAALGADPARIALLGESAGGGHAAMLAIAARDRGEVPVAFQCLVYPMLDDRTGSSRTVPGHVGKIIWNAASNRFGWTSFLGVPAGGRNAPAGGVPARVANTAGLPPAFIGVGSLDLFHDEDVDYAQRLNDAGVAAELIVVPGAFHGFDLMAAPPPSMGKPAAISVWFAAAKIEALRRALSAAA